MNKGSSIEAIDVSNLTDQTKFRLNKKTMIKNLVNALLLLIIVTRL